MYQVNKLYYSASRIDTSIEKRQQSREITVHRGYRVWPLHILLLYNPDDDYVDDDDNNERHERYPGEARVAYETANSMYLCLSSRR